MKETRQSLIQAMRSSLPEHELRAIEKITTVFIDTLISKLKEGNDIEIRGLGTFKQEITKERKVKIPSTDELITTKPKQTVKFKISSSFGVNND